MERFLSDLRYAARGLARSPGFSAIAILTVALGIGAATTVFSVIDAALLRPVPMPEPDRLVMVYSTSRGGNRDSVSYLNYLDWAEESRAVQELAAFRGERFTLTGRGLPEPILGTRASANLLAVLGVEPLRGRMFRPEEDRRGQTGVALLGEAFWRRRFSADESVLGQTITLNGRGHTIVGIMPERACLRRDEMFLDEVLVPLGQVDEELFWARGAADGTVGIGRLAPGVTLERVRSEMDRIAANLAATYPADNDGLGIAVVSLVDDLLAGREQTLVALFGAVGFVLLIACTNVANLLIARGAGRRQDLAIRASLGASRGQLVRQQLAESGILGLAGGGLGAILAMVSTPAVVAFLPSIAPALTEPVLDLRALAFSLAAAVGSGLLAGLLPAGAISGAGQVSAGRGVSQRSRAQRMLIVAEMALTLVLLAATGLMVRSLVRLFEVDPGLDPTNVSMFLTGISPERGATPDQIRATMRELGDQVASVPGVEVASVEVGVLPFGRGSSGFGFWLDSEPRPRPNQLRRTLWYGIGPEYLDVMRIPLRRGRNFTRADDSRTRRVALIDEELSRQAFPDRDPIGQWLRFGFIDEPIEIVGVVGHVKHWGLDRDATAEIRSQLYFPYAQMPDAVTSLVPKNVQVVLRSVVPLGTLLPDLRRAVAVVDASQAISLERTMVDEVAASAATRRLALTVLAGFALFALLLSCMGIYGVLSYLTAQRTAELGVRMAIGARPADVLWLVLREGQRLVAAGVAIGLVGAAALTRFISNLLYEVRPMDPPTLAAVVGILVLVTLAACYVPGRRASQLDPVAALKAE